MTQDEIMAYLEDMTEVLFDIEKSESLLLKDNQTCLTCEHRQRWKCNSKVFQYCGIRKSNRTSNGLLKIKCKDIACEFYLAEVKQ